MVAVCTGFAQLHLYVGLDLQPTARHDTLIDGAAGESLHLDPENGLRAPLATDVPVRPTGGLVTA